MRRSVIIKVHLALLSVNAALWSVPTFADQATPELRFNVVQGTICNEFFREGPVAAHIAVKSGQKPRIVVAFPAANSGVGLWFETLPNPVTWGAFTHIEGTSENLRTGIIAQTSINATRLDVKKAILSNVRVLRDYGYVGKIPEAVESFVRISGGVATWQRNRIDGAPGYLLTIEVLNGRAELVDNKVRFESSTGAPLRLRLTALTGDPPLTPIPAAALFTANANNDKRLRDVLTFLSYDEKLNAGSWRFNTYFGRDTLMSARLLMSAVTGRVTEAALRSVLLRMNARGEVAHEEDLEEYALLTRKRTGDPASANAILDYKMVDDDYMLAPVIAHYLLETTEGQARAPIFLAQKSADGTSYGALLVRNLKYVVETAVPFSSNPKFDNLIALQTGVPVGQWRDSNDGLGGGRYPYDVNAALVPAALSASARLYQSGLLDPYDSAGKQSAEKLYGMAGIWAQEAPKLFRVRYGNQDSRDNIAALAQSEKVDQTVALAALGNDDTNFHALALDGSGKPIPVMNSDEGFALLFGNPSAAALEFSLKAIMRPFPAGLMTPAGMLVANPAMAPASTRPIFARTLYHGMVIWSWQQALMAAGIARQRQRTDLPATTHAMLAKAEGKIWEAIDASRNSRASELWSWSVADGKFIQQPFGDRDGDETESNAAQLWSTAYLAVTRPAKSASKDH